MARPGVIITAACLALVCPAAHAQVYEFQDTPLAPNRSLRVLQLFYIFSREEAPGAGRSIQPATVTFKSIEGHSKQPAVTDADMAAYKSIQVSFVPFPSDLSEIINPTGFCATPADVRTKAAAAADQLAVLPGGRNLTRSHTVRFGPTPAGDAGAELQQGSVYALVLSNCGGFWNATISGSVAVRNSYGFLPGSEYYKLPFFGWLAIVYATLLVAWIGAMVLKRQELFFVHYYVLAVALLGLLECAGWWAHLSTWNSTGSEGSNLSCAVLFASSTKVSVAYVGALSLSLGWGVTLEALEGSTSRKVEALNFFYVVAFYVREATLSFRHSHNLPAPYLVGALLPMALLNALLFAWIFRALNALVGTVSESWRQDEVTSVLKSSRNVLGSAVAVAYTAFFLQVLEILQVFPVPWRYHWVLSDAICHAVFVAALCTIMLVWRPGMKLQAYSYSPQVKPMDGDMEDGDASVAPGRGVQPDDDDLEVVGLINPNSGPLEKASVSPEVIGLRDDKTVY